MKKVVKIILAGMLVISCILAGCGVEAVPEETVEEPPKTIHIYSDSDDISNILEYVWEKMPEGKERVEVVTLPKDSFVESLEAAMMAEDNEKCPDIIIADNTNVTHFTNAEYVDVITEEDYTEQELSQMYVYTKEAATDGEGNLKGLTWEINPGAFVYRKSVIAEYTGVADADNVQSFVKDWDTLIDTARAIDKKYSGEIKLLASADDVNKVFYEGQWPGAKESDKKAGIALILEKNKYSAGLAVDTDAYYNAANQGNIIGYFCDMNGLKKLEQRCSVASKEDWGICAGPDAFVTSGRWMFITKECSDRDFAIQLTKKLCADAEVQKNLFEKESIFVNNSEVMNVAARSTKGKMEFLGGNDYIAVFCKAASKVRMPEIEILETEEIAEEEAAPEQE